MKQYISLIIFSFVLSVTGCRPDNIGAGKEVGFIIFNESDTEILSTRFFLKEGNMAELTFDASEIGILTQENLPGKSKSQEKKIDLREFSTTGQGALFAELELATGDKLQTGLGNFKYYRLITEFAPKSWQTSEVVLRKNFQTNSPELFARIAKYSDGEVVDRF